MFLETLALSGLYDLVRFGGKLFVGKFRNDFKKAKKYAAAEVVKKYPEIFPSTTFADHIFRLEDKDVKVEVEKLTRGVEAIDENILITAVEKDLSEQFPGAKDKIKEVVSYFKKCMTEKLQENHEILNYFTHKKVENIVDLLKGVELNLDALMSACRKQVEKEVAKVGKKYIPTLYINRGIEKEFEQFINDKIKTSENCFLIIDRAGSGKTNLLCSLARKYVQEQPAVLVFGSIFLKDEFDIEEYIKKSLEYDPNVRFSSFQQCLDDLNEIVMGANSNLIIFIDAINENTDTLLMKRAVENILSKHSEKKFKFCITCRDIYWDFFKAEFWEEYVRETFKNQLYDFTSEEFEKALKRYFAYFNIKGELKDEALEKCKHPLLLRFFCEAYKDTDVDVVTDIRLDELFDRYWNRKIRSIAEKIPDRIHADKQVEDYLFSIAREMMRSHFRSIPSNSLEEVTGEKNIYHKDSIYTRILDEDIILEEELIEEGEEETRVVFVYEEFMEYVMAREIIKNEKLYEKNEEEILKVIDGLVNNIDKFTTIFGILVYLGLILKKVKNLSIWKLFIKKGSKCQEVIFESIRKLPNKEIDRSVFDVLEGLVNSGESETRKKVLDILLSKRFMESNKEDVIKILEILIKDEDWEIRKRTAKALGESGSDKAVNPLIQTLSDEISIVCTTAVQALRELGSEKTVDSLISALNDDKWFVRKIAAEALDKLKWEPKSIKDKAIYLVAKKKWKGCESIGEPAVEPLINVLKSDSYSVRMRAIVALRKIKSEKAVEPLINSLKDDNCNVRKSAIVALGKIKSEKAVEPLITVLKDDNYSVRKSAVVALGNIKSGKAVEPLIDALKDDHYNVRDSAAVALGKIKLERAVELLINAMKDNNYYIRKSVVVALGKIKSEKAVDPLINALKDEFSFVRKSAVDALGEIKSEKAVDPLINALKYDNGYVGESAALALGEIKSEKAVDSLIYTLKNDNRDVGDWNVGESAAVALKKIGTPKALKAVEKYEKSNK